MIGSGVALWLIFFLGRVYGGNRYGALTVALEVAGMHWMGSVFFIGGRYDIDGMTLIVSRGTGTWGPRMRLWATGDIFLITLLTPAPDGQVISKPSVFHGK